MIRFWGRDDEEKEKCGVKEEEFLSEVPIEEIKEAGLSPADFQAKTAGMK